MFDACSACSIRNLLDNYLDVFFSHVTQSERKASIIMQIQVQASIVGQMAKASEHHQTSPTCLGVHSFPGGAYITAADPGQQHSFITPQVPAIRHTLHCDLSPRSHPPSPRLAPAPSITTTQWRPATESHCQLYTAGAGTVSFAVAIKHTN